MNKQQNYSIAVLIPAQPGAFISVNWLRHIYTSTVENRMSFLATSSSSKLEGKIIVFNRISLFLYESICHFNLTFWKTAYCSTLVLVPLIPISINYVKSVLYFHLNPRSLCSDTSFVCFPEWCSKDRNKNKTDTRAQNTSSGFKYKGWCRHIVIRTR